MRLRLLTLVLAVVAMSDLVSTATAASELPARNAQRDAGRMMKGLTKGDFEQYLSYEYPEQIKRSGGKDANITSLTMARQSLQKYGWKPKKDFVRKPTEIFRIGNELHALLECHSVYQSDSVNWNEMEFISYLIGQSLDDGASWRFIVLLNDVKTTAVKSMLPSYDPKLIQIPSTPKPIISHVPKRKGN